MPRKAQRQAYGAVRRAIDDGVLAPLPEAVCAECGKPAAVYHHPNGYAPEHRLDVVALCTSCHGDRPHNHSDGDRFKRLTIELEEADESIVRRARVWAAQRGVTLREYVLVAVANRNAQEAEAGHDA